MHLWVYVVLSIFLNGSGQLFLKNGMSNLALEPKSGSSLFSFITNIFTSPFVLLGLILYGTSMLIWLKILTEADVSFAYPIVISSTFVIVTIGAAIFLNEDVGLIRASGIGVIILGVLLASQG